MEYAIVTKRIAIEKCTCAVCGRVEPGIIHSAESFAGGGYTASIEGADLIARSRGYPPGWEMFSGLGDENRYSCPDCAPRFHEAIAAALAAARRKR